MPQFRFRGYDSSGRPIEGELSAATQDEAERRIEAKEISLVSLHPVEKRRPERENRPTSEAPARVRRRISDGDAAVLLEDLAVMADAGVPFVEALDAIAASTKNKTIQEALRRIRKGVVGGQGLSSMMAEAGSIFPPLVAEMVAVAEAGGDLGKSLHAAAAHLERASDLRKSILQAMLYPIVLSCIATTAILFLVFFLLPKFATVFQSMGADIPSSTRALLEFNSLICDHPVQSFIAGVALAMGIYLGARAPATRIFAAGIARKAPFIGPFIRRLALARAFQSIATLLSTNVPLVSAIEHGANTAADEPIRASLMRAKSAVEQGAAFADALASSSEFPPTLVQMAAVGEKSGRLGDLMAASATSLSKDADRKLKTAVSILEPAMIVVMGFIVAAITMSVITPIYSVAENVR
jgi:type II secretory pathway component PulF